MKAWFAYRQLTPEQKAILRNPVLDLSGNADDLIKTLTPIAAFDTKVGGAAGSIGLGCAFLLATVVAVVAAIALWVDGASPVRVAVMVVSLALAIVLNRFMAFARRVDISDNLRGTALPLLKIIREDFARAQPVRLKMDLRVPTHKSKETGKSPEYSRGSYYHIVDTNYEDPWLTMTGQLNDGSRLRVRIVESLRVINRTKKGSSGKTRSNTRLRKKVAISVLLAVRRSRYDVQPVPPGVKVKSTDRRHLINFPQKTKVADHAPIAPLMVVDAIAGAHRLLRKARPQSEASAV